jgi:hypothetical protein
MKYQSFSGADCLGTLLADYTMLNLSQTVLFSSNITTLCYKKFSASTFILIYLLTAIGLSPSGSTHLHTNNT